MNNQVINESFDSPETVFDTRFDGDPIRLDNFVSEQCRVTRSKAANFIECGCVTVNGRERKKSYMLAPDDRVVIELPENEELDIVAENIPLDIVFEDKDLLVVNKAQGMVVHPAPGNMSGTLVNALMYHIKDLSGINGVLRPGIVHRIDKNTSGLLVVAKNDKAHVSLASQIKEHSFDRYYEAVVHGILKEKQGTVRYSIGRNLNDRKKMASFDENSTQSGVKRALTHYTVLEEFTRFSHLKLQLETGRTHQIRVHMKSIGHAVVGDDVYAGDKLPSFSLAGQCLHARCIGFVHPETAEHMVFESDLPEYFTQLIDKLRRMK